MYFESLLLNILLSYIIKYTFGWSQFHSWRRSSPALAHLSTLWFWFWIQKLVESQQLQLFYLHSVTHNETTVLAGRDDNMHAWSQWWIPCGAMSDWGFAYLDKLHEASEATQTSSIELAVALLCEAWGGFQLGQRGQAALGRNLESSNKSVDLILDFGTALSAPAVTTQRRRKSFHILHCLAVIGPSLLG